MKANELMIGDWVLYEGKPYQIRQLGIYGVDRDGEDYPAVCVGKSNGIGLILERNEIEPITLTPEILEKNGFNKTEFHIPHCILYYLGAEELYWDITNSSIGSWTKNIAGDYELYNIVYEWYNVCECKYVHQLQHVLRLCNIDKEIIL